VEWGNVRLILNGVLSMKKEHLYRITLEQLDGASPETVSSRLQLDFSNHDDIFGIIDREGPGRFGSLSAHDAALFIVGLKLLGKVLMENRKNELFSAFSTHFVDFMKKVKEDPSEK
jgi:hypothetical protein